RAADGRGLAGAEIAPSIIREEEPQTARTVGLVGLVAALLGTDLLSWLLTGGSILRAAWWEILRLRGVTIPTGGPGLSLIGALGGMGLFAGGIGGLPYPATVERDQPLRRAYGLLAAIWLAVGIVLVSAQMAGASWAGNLFLPGVITGVLALLFVLAF